MIGKSSLQKVTALAIIWEISDSNLETGRYGPKSGVSPIIWESRQHCSTRGWQLSEEYLITVTWAAFDRAGTKELQPPVLSKTVFKMPIVICEVQIFICKLDILQSTDIFHFILFPFVLQITVSLLAYVQPLPPPDKGKMERVWLHVGYKPLNFYTDLSYEFSGKPVFQSLSKLASLLAPLCNCIIPLYTDPHHSFCFTEQWVHT